MLLLITYYNGENAMRIKRFCMFAILVLLVSSVPGLYAEDFVTNAGKIYKNATVAQHNPAGIVIENQDGVFQIPFTELPEAIRKKYNYDPKKAEEFLKMRQKNVSKWDKERFDEMEKEKKGEEEVLEKVDTTLREEQEKQEEELQEESEPAEMPDPPQVTVYDDSGDYGYGYNYPYGYGYWHNHHYCPLYHQGNQGRYSGYKSGASPHDFGGGFHSGGGSHGGGGGGHAGGGGRR